MNIGKYNTLEVSRIVDFGAYLKDDLGTEVLLPAKYIERPLKQGDKVDVFVYRDSDDRPIAVTEAPFAQVGEFAFLQVSAVNRIGAFLDWGLPKDLLVPFREQKVRMREGGLYLVYVYLDHETGRVVASAKIEKFLDNVLPQYKIGQMVQALVYKHTDCGYACIVDNLHRGMIYHDELYHPVEIGETVKAAVHRVREDGKIDLVYGGNARERSTSLSADILELLMSGNSLGVTEKSSPELIRQTFHCSKKDFKKAVGHLLKERKIIITPEGEIKPVQ